MHIIFKLQESKDKILKETRGKNLVILRSKDKNSLRLLIRNHACKKRLESNIHGVESRTNQPRFLHSAQLPFYCEGEILPQKTKNEGSFQQKACPSRNAKGILQREDDLYKSEIQIYINEEHERKNEGKRKSFIFLILNLFKQ